MPAYSSLRQNGYLWDKDGGACPGDLVKNEGLIWDSCDCPDDRPYLDEFYKDKGIFACGATQAEALARAVKLNLCYDHGGSYCDNTSGPGAQYTNPDDPPKPTQPIDPVTSGTYTQRPPPSTSPPVVTPKPPPVTPPTSVPAATSSGPNMLVVGLVALVAIGAIIAIGSSRHDRSYR